MNNPRRIGHQKRILWLSLLIFSAVAFQNCAPMSFSGDTVESTFKLDNNGGVYGGKPTGTFYRFTPGFTCEQKEAPTAVLEISNTSSEITENKQLLCNAIKQQLNLALIDSSIYQDQIVGYLEGIYEGQSEAPQKIPSNLVEVWCKDRNDEQGIETITHFDRSQNLAVNRIYYSEMTPSGELKPREIPDSSVARIISQNTLIVKNEQGFELTVHRDQPASQIGLFKAEMKVMITGQSISRETACRLGGSVDPSVWPSKQIVDLNVQAFQLSPDLSSIAFSANNPAGIANLFAADPIGTSYKQIAPNMQSPGIEEFHFASDSKTLVYRGSQRLTDVPEVFKVNFDGTGQLRLGNALASVDDIDRPDRLTNLIVAPDSSFVIFKDAFGNTRGDASLNLNVAPLTGGGPQRISLPFTDSFGVWGYNYSSQANRIVYLEGSPTHPDLYSVRPDGSGHLDITPVSSSSPWMIRWYDELNLSAGGKFVILDAIGREKLEEKYFAIAVDGSRTIPIPDGFAWRFSNAFDSFALLSNLNLNLSLDVRLLNLETGNLVKIPALQDAVFTKDSASVAGLEKMPDGRFRSKLVTAASGSVTELCPGVFGSLMKVLEIGTNQFIILAYDSDSRILNVHMKDGAAACAKVNSIVTTRDKLDYFREILISPDSRKLLVHMEVSKFSGTFRVPGTGNQLYYIPLNGRPSVLINASVSEAANITKAAFLGDSQTVVYVGDQLRLGEIHVYCWKTPIP